MTLTTQFAGSMGLDSQPDEVTSTHWQARAVRTGIIARERGVVLGGGERSYRQQSDAGGSQWRGGAVNLTAARRRTASTAIATSDSDDAPSSLPWRQSLASTSSPPSEIDRRSRRAHRRRCASSAEEAALSLPSDSSSLRTAPAPLPFAVATVSLSSPPSLFRRLVLFGSASEASRSMPMRFLIRPISLQHRKAQRGGAGGGGGGRTQAVG